MHAERALETSAPTPISIPDRKARQAEAALLVERCKDGDTAAFSELYDRFSGLLFAVAQRVLRNMSSAEEVLQESFLYAWQNVDSYDPKRSSVSTWLVMIVRSRAIDRIRRKGHQARIRDRVRQESPTEIAPVADDSVLDGERRIRVREALADLSPEQRTVLDLAYYGGLTQRQIATTMQIPLGTVKTRTHLAYRKLRKALAPEVAQLSAI